MSDDYPRASTDEQRAVVTAISFLNQWRKAKRDGDADKADNLLCSIYRHLEEGYLGQQGINSHAALTFMGEYYRHKGDANQMERCIEGFATVCGMKVGNAIREAEEITNGTHPELCKKGKVRNQARELTNMLRAINAIAGESLGSVEVDASDEQIGEKIIAGLPKQILAKLPPEKAEKIREFFADDEKERSADDVAKFFATLLPGVHVTAAKFAHDKDGKVVSKEIAYTDSESVKEEANEKQESKQ